mgnify:CR=1 FL=1
MKAESQNWLRDVISETVDESLKKVRFPQFNESNLSRKETKLVRKILKSITKDLVKNIIYDNFTKAK